MLVATPVPVPLCPPRPQQLKNYVSTSQRTKTVSLIKTDRVQLFKDMVGVCFHYHTKYLTALHRKVQVFY